MKTTKQHFELFKKECRYWEERLKLDGWTVYYHHGKASKGAYATTRFNLVGRASTIFFTDEFEMIGVENVNDIIKKVAKHEMIHVLLGRLSGNASYRYVNEDELVEAEEELVRKLEKIIK